MSSQGDQQGGGAGSWWGWGDSLLQTVKKQSETIISIYKEDLSEFTRTIKEDTMSVVKDVVKHDDGGGRGSGGSGSGGSTSSASGAKRPPAKASSGSTSRSGRSSATTSSSGLNTFFDFMDSLKDEEEEEVLAKSRREKGVKKLQKDMNTYTQEPADEEDFKEWKANFNLEAHTVEISQLLSANNKMRAIHNELLPKLSYSVFWERYYYRFEKLLKDEERREKILMRAELDNKLDDWGGWEDDESVDASTEGAVTAEADVVEEAAGVEGEGEAKEASEDADAEGKDELPSEEATEETASEATTVDEADAAAVVNAPHDDSVQPASAETSDVPLVEAAAAPALEEEPAVDVPVTDDTPAQQEDKAANPEEEGDEDYDFLLVAEDPTQAAPASPGLGDGDDDGWDAWE